MTAMRELTINELELVGGGKVYTSKIAGFTFTHDDKTGETTTSAGDYSVTTGKGFVSWTGPA
jgi:hypothetical protein